MASKGQKFKHWSKEEKIRIVKKIVYEGKSSYQVAREENILSTGMIRRWVKLYVEQGENALENKKNLTKEEQLEYENMKLRIENELLKKGYLMKGDGTIVKFTK